VIELRGEGLSARYPGQPASMAALIDIDIDVPPGERLLLLGPNGAGKSTFIRVFAGLMRAAHGRALIGGEPARHARKHVGVVSHATYLYDELTAAENLRLYAALYGVAEPNARLAFLLEHVGIAHLCDVQVGRLSRGQQQRVSIARALLHDPPLLLLDEPDAGLDVAAFALVAEIISSPGRTVVVTTHNLATGLRLGTRAAILARGHLVHQQPILSADDADTLARRLESLARE